MTKSINLRSTIHANELKLLADLCSKRRNNISSRKELENDVKQLNDKLEHELKQQFKPIAKKVKLPFVFNIYDGHCKISVNISIKGKHSYETITYSKPLQSFDKYSSCDKGFKLLLSDVTKALRYIKLMIPKSDKVQKPYHFYGTVEILTRTRYFDG